MNRKCHIEKCWPILKTEQCRKLETDSTKTIEQTGSKPGAFYGSFKVYKLKGGEGLKEISLRSIIYYIETETCSESKISSKPSRTLTHKISSIV